MSSPFSCQEQRRSTERGADVLPGGSGRPRRRLAYQRNREARSRLSMGAMQAGEVQGDGDPDTGRRGFRRRWLRWHGAPEHEKMSGRAPTVCCGPPGGQRMEGEALVCRSRVEADGDHGGHGEGKRA